MKIFWQSVIRPLAEAGGVRSIVEIGAEKGDLTERMADWAQEADGVVHSIDPTPMFDPEKLQERHRHAFRFYPEPSLDALPRIGKVDMALIDGDHNWFTVHSELELLAVAGGLPITLLHDTAWPYGRRDLYYDPASIPDAHRHPHARAGIAPGINGVVGDGFNSHLDHAEHEGGPKNGVLTAIEDFLDESEEEIEALSFPLLHGLTVLVPASALDDNPALREQLKRLRSKRFLQRLARMTEEDRLVASRAAQNLQRHGRGLDAESNALRRRIEVRDEELDVVAHQLLDSEDALAAERVARERERAESERLRGREEGLRSEVDRLEIERAGLGSDLEAARRKLADAVAERESVGTELAAAAHRVALSVAAEGELQSRIARLEGGLASEASKHDETRAALSDAAEARDREVARAEALGTELDTVRAELAERQEAARDLQEQLARASAEEQHLRESSAELEAGHRRLRTALEATQERSSELEAETERLRLELERHRGALLAQQDETERFVGRVEAERGEIADAARRLAASRSWRFGHGLFLALKRLKPGRTREESALDVIGEKLERPLGLPAATEAPELIPRAVLAGKTSSDTQPKPAPEPAGGGESAAAALRISPRRGALDRELVNRLAAAPPVTVVVPVHDAPGHVRRCLEAVARNTSLAAEVLIIDDASVEAETAGVLEDFAELSGVRVLRNEENLGFTATVNRGLAESAGDVVLLNSDTEVGPRWLEGLRTAAYSAADIATVTPLSDNAGAFSAPTVGEANEVPGGMGVEDIARLVAQGSRRIRPTTPTGSGFCLYVRREAIDAVGEFDAVAFPRGYGEENDFCMRAGELGWRHLVDDATYVKHVREASFREEKAELLKAGRKAVDERHPAYTSEVRSFVRSAAMEEARATVGYAFEHQADERPRPRVLFVLHEGAGGTPATNSDLAAALAADYDCFVLTSDSVTVRLRRYGRVSYEVDAWKLERPWSVTDFERDDFAEIALEVLTGYAIELVHVRHLFKWSLDLPVVARTLGIPVIVSCHDFYLSCPTVHLLDDQDRYCGGECTPGDGECRLPSPLLAGAPHLKHDWVEVWRERVGLVLEGASALVTTSPHAREVYRRTYPSLSMPFEVIEHGRDFARRATISEPPRAGEPLRVLVPGGLDFHKGAAYLARIKELDSEGRIELHFLGATATPETEGLGTFHGPYERDEFAAAAAAIRPAVAGIFSVWPETFCHVLTESWAAGIPVVANDIGALGERIRAHGGGWLTPHDDPRRGYERLIELAGDPDAIEAAAREVASIELRDTAAMAADYDALYRRVFQARRPIVASGNSPRTAGLNSKVLRISACVPGRPGAEPGSSHVRVLTRLSHPTVATKVQASYAYSDKLLGNGLRPDLLLIQRTAVAPDLVAGLLERVVNTETPLVLELDDDLMLLDRHPSYGPLVETLRNLIGAASAVTVSTSALANSIEENAKRVAIIRNALDERLWFSAAPAPVASEKAPGDPAIRVLYMGTRTHAKDLQILRPAFERLRAEAGIDIGLEVIGGEPEGPDQDWYTRLDVDDGHAVYPRFVRWLRARAGRWDLAVAPLVDDEFNRSKSDLKYLEYTALGLPTVVSDVEAYGDVEDGVSALRVANDTDSWASALETLAADPVRASELVANATAEVRAERCLDAEASRYLSVLCDVAERG